MPLVGRMAVKVVAGASHVRVCRTVHLRRARTERTPQGTPAAHVAARGSRGAGGADPGLGVRDLRAQPQALLEVPAPGALLEHARAVVPAGPIEFEHSPPTACHAAYAGPANNHSALVRQRRGAGRGTVS